MRQIARKAVWLWMNHSILGLLVLLCLALALLSDRFFTLGNWANILNNLSVTGIVSLGVALVIISGGIDLSFGSILGCCAVLAAWLQPHGFWPAVMGPLVLGAALGAFNGLLVAGIRANPLIATLGTQWLFSAVLLIITGGQLVQGARGDLFHAVGNGRLAGVPFPIWLLFAAAGMTWCTARYSLIGKHLYAHGSNARGLRLSGVNADRVYLAAFVLMGLLVAVAGILLSSRLVGVRPTEGQQYLIIVLTAVLLSGISLRGGVGSIFNVVVAVVFLAVMDNGMVLLGVEYKYQQMIRGMVFVLSIIYSNHMIRQVMDMRIPREA